MMNNNRINHTLYSGNVNKSLRVNYIYKVENERFQTVKSTSHGFNILPGFSISISEGFEMDKIFIPGGFYHMFVALFHKSIPIVQQHIHELYPNLNQEEFEINSRVLERFMTEKALGAGGTSIVPDKWVDQTGKCYPALKVDGLYGHCKIPLEDCIALDQLFMTFDPLTFGLIMLNMLYE